MEQAAVPGDEARRRPVEAMLPVAPQAVAPDGSLVRLLVGADRGSMAHFELGAHEVSRAQRHRTVDELWFVLSGSGVMWRQQDGASSTEVEMRPGLSLSIPVGTSFQFRSTSREPLAVVGVTMPPWPGEGEAMEVVGPWQPRLVEVPDRPGASGPV